MAYDWRPTGNRAATTTAPRVVVPPRRPPTRSPPRSEPPGEVRVATVVDEFIEAAQDGRASNRSGRLYRPSALRDLRGILRHHVARDLGHMRLRDVRGRHVQAVLDRLAAEGLSESRIRSVISAVRALYGYAIDRGYAELSPATGLTVPSRDERRTDDVDRSWGEEPAPRTPRARPKYRQSPPPTRDAGDYEPVALLPERLLSFALRLTFAIFILVVIVSIAGPA
jgi:Phage integrase, N-terminal SAM-like domain